MSVEASTPRNDSSGAAAQPRTVGGRYTLRTSVGSGGMGTVWRAFDELLRREVAVKEVLLPPGLPGPERELLCERTLREARAAAALNHTAVIRVYDVVNDGDRPWIVMELLEARSIADVLREDGPIPAMKVAEIGLAVLGALEAAHRVGVLHRDVKPGNVLLGPDVRVTLTDFGVARSPNESPLTSTGLLLGSPQYIAPERARGRPFGPPSDLFSLGATLYTAVEGRPPFDRRDPLPTMTAVVCEPPDAMTFAGPLAPVLLGLMEKDPGKRWDAPRARAALRTVLAGGRVVSLEDGPARPAAPERAALARWRRDPGEQPSTGAGPGPGAHAARGVPASHGTAAMEVSPIATQTSIPRPPARSAPPAARQPPAAPQAFRPGAPVPPDTAPRPTSGGTLARPTSPARPGPAGPPRMPPGRLPFAVSPGDAGPGGTRPSGPPQGSGGSVSTRPTTVVRHGGYFGAGGPPPGQPPRHAGHLGEPPPVGRQPTASGRRFPLWLFAVAAAVILVVGLGTYAISAALSGDGGGAQKSDSLTVGTGVTLTAYQDTRGFSVQVPRGWKKQKGQTYVDFQDPAAARKVRLLVEDAHSGGVKAHLEAAEKRQEGQRRQGAISAFRTLRLEKTGVALDGGETWEWEWTFTKDGEERRILWRSTVRNGKTYTVFLGAPADRFDPNRPLFDEITRTFRYDS